jgi:GGDEF domain-containing protein
VQGPRRVAPGESLRWGGLQELLLSDVLSGLPNRRALMEALPEALHRAARSGKPCALLFLDLDSFKGVNQYALAGGRHGWRNVGLALHLPDQSHDVEGWMTRADNAMYAAKRSGKGTVALAPEAATVE